MRRQATPTPTPTPNVGSVGLSDAHGVTAAIDSGGTIAITFEADTDMGGTPLGWTVSHAAPGYPYPYPYP
jgi:hypothetical protein